MATRGKSNRWMWTGELSSDDEILVGEKHSKRKINKGAVDDDGDDDDWSRASSSYSYTSEMELLPWKGEAERVVTSFGEIQVTVYGDRNKAPLLTYHGTGLNHMTCFQGLFLCADTAALLLHNFCVYQIDAPGHEVNAPEIYLAAPKLSAEDMADQVADIIEHFRLKDVMVMGVAAGAYILTVLAINHPDLVRGLILVSPICKAPSWTEWAHTKVLLGLLWAYGMTKFVKDSFVQEYLTQEQVGFHGPGSESVLAFRNELDEKEPANVARYLQTMQRREDLTDFLNYVQCPTLIAVGEMSVNFEDAVLMYRNMDRKRVSWSQVQACGTLVTEERPHTLALPLEGFLKQFGFQRPSLPEFSEHYIRSSFFSSLPSPSSVASTPCCSAGERDAEDHLHVSHSLKSLALSTPSGSQCATPAALSIGTPSSSALSSPASHSPLPLSPIDSALSTPTCAHSPAHSVCSDVSGGTLRAPRFGVSPGSCLSLSLQSRRAQAYCPRCGGRSFPRSEDLSLAEEQQRLKPVKTRKAAAPLKADDDDDW